MENLRSDKEGYFHFLVFYRLVYKRNRKHFFRVPIRFRNTRERLGGFEVAFLPNFHSCFYNCMETRKMFSIS